MSASKTIVLVTGGNSGVGFELAHQLLADASKHVLLGCRSKEKGEAAARELSTRELPGTVEFLEIDVTVEESILAAAKVVEDKHGKLDAIVNNAAIGSLQDDSAPLGEKMMSTYRTNAVGVLLVCEAFLSLLRKSTGTPRIINVSSAAGSVSTAGASSQPIFGMQALPYNVSKAAMNMITASLVRIYGGEGIKVFAYTPGLVVSNLGGHNNAESGARPASEGAAPMIPILNGERDGEHGCLLDAEGQRVW